MFNEKNWMDVVETGGGNIREESWRKAEAS